MAEDSIKSINSRQTVSMLPFVDGLRSCKTQHFLEFFDRNTGLFTQKIDVLPGLLQVYHWNLHHGSSFPCFRIVDSTVGWNRTSDQLCIRQPLWPTELRQHDGTADWGWTSNLRLMKAVLYHWATAVKSCWPASNRWPAPYESATLPFELQQHMELPTGLEPATSALQGRLSSHWVTAANKKPVPAGTSVLRLGYQIRLSIHWTDYSRTDPGIRSMRAWQNTGLYPHQACRWYARQLDQVHRNGSFLLVMPES